MKSKPKHYVHTQTSVVRLIKLSEIDETIRDPGVPIYRTQETYQQLKDRMINELPLDPVIVHSIGWSNSKKHILRDGCHRYHISKELGFEYIPVLIDDYDVNEFFAAEAKGTDT